jgi:predicted ATPase
VLIVDDIHWAEPALLDLLARLPGALPGSPVLVLCLSRRELHERSPEWPVTVRLEPLADEAAAALLASLGAPAEVRTKLAQAAAGNPLYAEELVAMLVDEGILKAAGEGFVLQRPLEEIALPVSLNALLSDRLVNAHRK